MNRRFKGKTCAMLCMMLVLSALPFVGCHKPEPTREVVLNWDMGEGWDNIHMDTIKKYTKQPDVKTVTLHLNDYYKSADWTPDVFNLVCDSVEKRFKYSDKVKGSGTIFVDRVGGAQLPSVDIPGCGMAEVDSIRFSRMGYNIARFNPYRH